MHNWKNQFNTIFLQLKVKHSTCYLNYNRNIKTKFSYKNNKIISLFQTLKTLISEINLEWWYLLEWYLNLKHSDNLRYNKSTCPFDFQIIFQILDVKKKCGVLEEISGCRRK